MGGRSCRLHRTGKGRSGMTREMQYGEEPVGRNAPGADEEKGGAEVSVSPVRGKLVADAWHAALAIEYGCRWVSTDGDFARFRGLDWRHPLA